MVIRTPDDFLLTPEGKEYPSIEWKEVKGVRDVIAHHYFDIDANEIFSIINNDFDSLKDAILFFKEVLTDK